MAFSNEAIYNYYQQHNVN